MGLGSDTSRLAALVAAAQDGDTDAVATIYDLLAPDIFRYAMTIVRNKEIAEDVASEAFLRAWMHLDAYHGGSFRALLYTIARNYAYDVLRKDRRVVALDPNIDPVDPDHNVLRDAVRSEQSRLTLDALTELTDDQRDVLTLRFMAGFTVQETAEVLERTEVSVRVLQCRALKALKKRLV